MSNSVLIIFGGLIIHDFDILANLKNIRKTSRGTYLFPWNINHTYLCGKIMCGKYWELVFACLNLSV